MVFLDLFEFTYIQKYHLLFTNYAGTVVHFPLPLKTRKEKLVTLCFERSVRKNYSWYQKTDVPMPWRTQITQNIFTIITAGKEHDFLNIN